MTGYYLGERVEVVKRLAGGWVLCQWPGGKCWCHWGDQIKTEPWGREAR